MKSEFRTTERNYYIDCLKLLLIIFVIMTHSEWARNTNNPYLFCYVIDMAVPAFLIISGMVNHNSLTSNRDTTTVYNMRQAKAKLIRIIRPFVLCAVIDLCVWAFVQKYDVLEIARLVVLGRWGDGGYYPYILIQFIFLFPIIYNLTNSKYGFFLIITINIVFELLTKLSYIPESVHRISICRYLIFIVAGIVINKYKYLVEWRNIIGVMLLGALSVYLANYVYPFNKLIPYWRSTSYLITIWPASIVCLVTLLSKTRKPNILIIKLSYVGRSTYYIMLFQMIYYVMIKISLFKEPHLFFSIIICCCGGYVWYCLDNKVPLQSV